MKKILIIIGLILLVCLMIFVEMEYQNKRTKKEFDLFYSNLLSGKIIKIKEYSRGSNFMLENDPNEYSFYPYIDKDLNNSEIFQYIAKPGDVIFKPAYSDTLFLITGNKKYAYTFQKM